jgi:hypothetical protein
MIPSPDHLRAIVEAATRRVNGEPAEPADREVLEVPWETVLTLTEALLSTIGELDTTDEFLRQLEEAANGVTGRTLLESAGVAQRRDSIARVLLMAGGRA